MKGYVYKYKRYIGAECGRIMYRLQFNGFKNLLMLKKLIGFINPEHDYKFKKIINASVAQWLERRTKLGEAHKRVYMSAEKT